MAPPPPPTQRCSDDPVLIIGAGISGLLLAQHLLHRSVPFRIFDRDADFTTRGVATEAQRIRVTRERLRQLIAEDIPIEWSRAFSSFEEQGERVIVKFDDGSEATGRIVVGCDGSTSRVRRAVFPEQYKGYHLPIRVLGFTAKYTAQEIAPMKTLDPFFLQATSSQDNNFMYFSILDAPGNTPQSNKADSVSMYTGQVVVSWPYRPGFQSRDSPLGFPENEDAKRALISSFAQSWAEPFRSTAMGVASGAERGPSSAHGRCLPRHDHVQG
ncbi:FAD-dependent monooxygenase like protein [Verticillium longisporum]|nr:FAD-dependent monooxygenase like protein [Verticillium longisporum]